MKKQAEASWTASQVKDVPARKFFWDGGDLELARQKVFVQHTFAFNLLHISDMHFSPGDKKYLDELEALLKNIEEPIDLITLGGDFVNDDEGIAWVPEFLRRLPDGVPKLAVLGNHDFYQMSIHGYWLLMLAITVWRGTRPLDTPRLRKVLEEGGVRLFEDAGARVDLSAGPLYVYGMRQPFLRQPHRPPSGRPPPVEPGCFHLLLVHRPDIPPEYAEGYHLVLGGHTHGGQIAPPGLGALRTNCRIHPATAAGHYRIGSAQWIVNNGFSSDVHTRVRWNRPRQISLIEVRPGINPSVLPQLRFCRPPQEP